MGLRWLGLLFLAFPCDAANVLVVILMPSISHQIPALSLSVELLRRGHHVTYVGTNTLPELIESRNCSLVDLSFAYSRMTKSKTSNSTINFQQKLSRWVWPDMYQNSFNLAREEIQSTAFQQLLREAETGKRLYDSILIEGKYALILVPLLRKSCGNVPIIALSSLSTDMVIETAIGSIQHLSFVPMLFNGYTDHMSFWQRLDNWFSTLWLFSSLQSKTFVVAEEILAEHGVRGVSEDEVYRNISLFMMASNHMYFYPRMLAPNVVTVGPLHIRNDDNATLPEDIQAWLEGAEVGAIYVSFGSNMKSSSLPTKAVASLAQVLSELAPKYRILWKWESSSPLPGQPGNIYTAGWFPQQKVLAHPKVKLFITQGGLQSFQEAVHFGVPLLGVPFFGDQNLNVAKIVASGIGVRLDPNELTNPELLREALNTLLLDKKFAERMKHFSRIARDFTAKGMDNAVMMVEHVTKFGGEHLRPSTAETSYAKFFCWDILGFLFAIALSAFFTLGKLLQCVYHKLVKDALPHLAMRIKKREGETKFPTLLSLSEKFE